MDEAERFAFVFGTTVDRRSWEAAGPEGRRALLEQQFPDPDEARLLLRLAVVQQLIAGDPPDVWETAQRLTGQGADVDLALRQIAMVFALTVAEGMKRGSIDQAAYAARLAHLPLPARGDIEAALLEVASAAKVLATGELVALAAQRLGFEGDDPVIVDLVEHVEEALADEFGPLAWLSGDRTAHVGSLCQGIVLTHMLSGAERQIGTLSVSFDLAGFGHLDGLNLQGQPVEAISAEPGHLAWIGPDGWLDRFEADRILAVRVDPHGGINLEPLAEPPPVDPDLVAALRRVYDDAVEEPQLPATADELILGLLADDRAAFAAPQAPLSALCEAAGLERQASAVAHDPQLWDNFRTMGRISRVTFEAGGDTDIAERALEILELLDELDAEEPIDMGRIRRALDGLADLEVLGVVTDELLADHGGLVDAGAVAARLVEAAQGSAQRAIARLLAAMVAETGGDWLAAEQHLELAVEADPSNVPATDRLAWYASDHGDAVRAARLWRRCPRSITVAQDLATVEPFTRPTTPAVGRNERCWCGSGRKYKHCHIDVVAPPALRDRIGWLYRKAVGYLERMGPEARAAVFAVAGARAAETDDLETVMDDPLVTDLVLTEGGWFEGFLADRGHLLPDDEALLAASWTAVERTVYEITATTPNAGLRIRDLRTGDELDVRERSFSRTAWMGMLVCGRAVPDGETQQFIGGVFPVVPGTEAELLDLLDERDPSEIAAWARDLYRAPRLRNRENERLVDCVVEVTTDDLDRLVAHLDATYEIDEPGLWWTEHHHLDDAETVIRAHLHLTDDRLTITTHSSERADRILARLRRALDVTVVADTRTPVELDSVPPSLRSGPPDLGELDAGPEPAVVGEAIVEIQGQMEDRWCAEPVPALGGLTPRQAAADPTRREQLERLLASFDATTAPPGAFTMRTERLRTLLGL